jgi:hypothetical protein
MTSDLTWINNKLGEMIEEFDGFEREFTIPGLWLTKFLGTRVDFELTLTNCVGD